MPVDTKLAYEMWNRYAVCRDNGHLSFVERADKCDKFFAGDQWDERDAAALRVARRPAILLSLQVQ